MDIWDTLEQELRKACPALELRKRELMAKYTSFRVGGPAALMALPKTEVEAKTAVTMARRFGVVPFFMGNGSNLLVADTGYDGFVLQMGPNISAYHFHDEMVTAEGGASLSSLAFHGARRGLTGLEFASGIPGTVGGAVTMNAGAYGGEMSQVVAWVKVMDEMGNIENIPAENCGFLYRHSAFSDGKRLILEAAFALACGDPAEIKEKMAELSAQRKAKQPLEYPSAGSTFKRPPPVDGQPVYAAALIDRCGLKGLTVGGAQVSEKHAGFIINKGGATCGDILRLVEQVKDRVFAETGVALELEVKTLGV